MKRTPKTKRDEPSAAPMAIGEPTQAGEAFVPKHVAQSMLFGGVRAMAGHRQRLIVAAAALRNVGAYGNRPIHPIGETPTHVTDSCVAFNAAVLVVDEVLAMIERDTSFLTQEGERLGLVPRGEPVADAVKELKR